MPKKGNARTVIVTGGAGFIGSQLADRLVREGFAVIIVDDLSTGRREYVPPKAEFHRMNIADPKLTGLFVARKPSYVFHLAAQIDLRASIENPIRDAETNIHGSLRVLEGCVKSGVKKLIFSSSGGAMYHKPKVIPTPESEPAMPVSPYGVAKLAFEKYLHAALHLYKLPYVALRYANVYGPRQDLRGEAGVIGIFAGKLLRGECPVIFGDGKQTRDFVFVDDVVEANVKAMRVAKNGIYNIGTGIETSINRLVALLRESTGQALSYGRGPAAEGEERRSALKSALAAKDLKWRPEIALEEGISRTVAWFKERS